MSLSKDSVKKLKKEFKSYKSFTCLFIDVIKVNKFSFRKNIKLTFFILISILLSFYLIKFLGFKNSFTNLTDLNMTLSIGLIGLLIGGFSIVLSSLNNDTIYYLILNRDESNNDQSTYKITLLFCVEPLLWFSLLLILTFSLKIIYLIYPSITVNLPNETINFLKVVTLSLLLILSFISLNSLITFIINMYNIIASNASFSVLSRYAKQNGLSLEKLIEQLEEQFNKSNKDIDKNK